VKGDLEFKLLRKAVGRGLRMLSRIWISVLASFFAAKIAITPVAAQQPKKPNIVFMLTDNLGYGELGVYGGGILRGAPTPRVDALASEGMRLLNFNVEAQCTPSRLALMTGRFSIRSGTYEVPIGGGLDGLTLWEITIAELLSAQGYATGMWGKWHLGSAEDRFPTHQGFDEWYGIPAHLRRGDVAFVERDEGHVAISRQ
jgi:arylsulfatase A-like enzyme